MSKKKQIITTPLTAWLLEYMDEHDLTPTGLSLQAGLSAGSIRSLIKFPERKPKVETCLRLSDLTGKPADEILQMAGLHGVPEVAMMSPERIEILQRFQRLPGRLKILLLKIAKDFDEYASEGGADQG